MAWASSLRVLRELVLPGAASLLRAQRAQQRAKQRTGVARLARAASVCAGAKRATLDIHARVVRTVDPEEDQHDDHQEEEDAHASRCSSRRHGVSQQRHVLPSVALKRRELARRVEWLWLVLRDGQCIL